MTSRPERLRVFAVTDTWAQVTWRAMAPGRHAVEIGGVTATVDADGGPGEVKVAGLAPDHPFDVVVDGTSVARARTTASLEGPSLARIAAVSDLHVGQDHAGLLPRVREAGHPLRCLRAAVAEISGWAPDVLVVKGDVADEALAEEYRAAADELSSLGVPLVVIPGNHDGANHRSADIAACLGARGIAVTTGVSFVDLPGVRVVAMATNHHLPRHWAEITATVLDGVKDALASAPGPCLLVVHHPLEPWGLPDHWPLGVWGRAAYRLRRAVADANPATVVTCGHSHRHRLRTWRGLPIAETGSTKDHPGVWAAYEAHRGGIRQTVIRIGDPDVLRWTERTADILFGQWGRWSPGRLDDRCFVHRWPAVPARTA